MAHCRWRCRTGSAVSNSCGPAIWKNPLKTCRTEGRRAVRGSCGCRIPGPASGRPVGGLVGARAPPPYPYLYPYLHLHLHLRVYVQLYVYLYVYV